MKKIPVIALIVLAMTVVVAQANDFTIDWYTVDGGGETLAAGGDYELSGTIGQPVAGNVLAGGDFELVGGFWSGAFVEELCYGDLNDDREIGLSDLAELLAHYGLTCGAAYGDGDLDDDGDVDLSDLAALLSVYGATCE